VRRHGLAGRDPRDSKRHPLYARWVSARQRCRNPRHPRYADWGGRGIEFDARWDDFATFLADMGEPPGRNYADYSLDRIDVDGPYAPGNVRWATRIEQGANKRNAAQRTAEYRTPWPFGVLAEAKDGFTDESEAAVRYLLGVYDRGLQLTADEEAELDRYDPAWRSPARGGEASVPEGTAAMAAGR